MGEKNHFVDVRVICVLAITLLKFLKKTREIKKFSDYEVLPAK
jgi:hypothetical protein